MLDEETTQVLDKIFELFSAKITNLELEVEKLKEILSSNQSLAEWRVKRWVGKYGKET